MFFKVERMLREGSRAWRQGELDRAVKLLEAALAARPGSIDAVFPLARALSERNEPGRALALLDGAIAREPASDPARVFRAIVLHDHGRTAEAGEELSRVSAENVIARAISALIALRARNEGTESITIPRGARWIPDIAGRLLAIFEERFIRKEPEEAVSFHHTLFAPAPEEASGPIEEAFANQRYEEAAKLHGQEAETPGRKLGLQVLLRGLAGLFRRTKEPPRAVKDLYLAFSLVALGRDEKALRALREGLARNPASCDIHFIQGLCHARSGRLREAGWSFARAARLSDIDVDGVLREVARKAKVAIEIAD